MKRTLLKNCFSRPKALEWEMLIPPDGKFTVTGTSVKSVLHSVPACQKIVKKAIVDRLSEAYGISEFPETGAEYTVKATLLKDRVTLTVDTSGAGLHKRGYRIKMWRRRSRRRWLLPWCSCLSGKKAGSWWIHAVISGPFRSRLLHWSSISHRG